LIAPDTTLLTLDAEARPLSFGDGQKLPIAGSVRTEVEDILRPNWNAASDRRAEHTERRIWFKVGVHFWEPISTNQRPVLKICSACCRLKLPENYAKYRARSCAK